MHFGARKIWPPLLLAPMAGLTHSALRTTILAYGGIGLLSTEMLSAKRLPSESAQRSPYLIRTSEENPLSYQLLLADEHAVLPAIDALHRLQADAIDLNLGCPAPHIRKSGAGSALMDKPDLVARIVAKARQCTTLPLSAKIRLDVSENSIKLQNFCRMLEGEGIDLITVHARLSDEPFSRRPRWHWLSKIKKWVRLPIVANGSIDSVSSARVCLEQSGADGLMIGRKAAIAPWIFAEIAKEVYGEKLELPEISLPKAYQHLANALATHFPAERRLGRLKEFTHYFAKNYPFGHHLASQVQASMTFQQAWQRAALFFLQHDTEQATKAFPDYHKSTAAII